MIPQRAYSQGGIGTYKPPELTGANPVISGLEPSGEPLPDLANRTSKYHSCLVTLEKKGTLFWEDHFSGAATKQKGKKGATEQLRYPPSFSSGTPLVQIGCQSGPRIGWKHIGRVPANRGKRMIGINDKKYNYGTLLSTSLEPDLGFPEESFPLTWTFLLVGCSCFTRAS